MAITAAMVKELREISGAGMMDCKKALAQTDGNIEKAVEFLREKGLAAMAKKANRVAAEGLVATKVTADGKTAAIVEVNSETDFVAKNADFQAYVANVVGQVLDTKADSLEAFMAEPWCEDATLTVEQALSSKIAIIGEKLSIRRFAKLQAPDGLIATYIHAGGKIGVLVEFETTASAADLAECGKNIAMQIAAMNAKYVDRSEVSADFIEKETEILKAAAMNENPDKPENIIDKMIIGRLNKELKEVCLVDQVYVKDGDLTVKKYIDSVAKEIGAPVKIKSFVRYETGEGIEKKEENFAEEVAKQIGV